MSRKRKARVILLERGWFMRPDPYTVGTIRHFIDRCRRLEAKTEKAVHWCHHHLDWEDARTYGMECRHLDAIRQRVYLEKILEKYNEK